MSSQRSCGMIESRLSVNSADPQLGVEQREDNLERDAESKRRSTWRRAEHWASDREWVPVHF